MKEYKRQALIYFKKIKSLYIFKKILVDYRNKYACKMKQMIEEEEIRLLRKELIPKAQLMPFFDRPFYPQR